MISRIFSKLIYKTKITLIINSLKELHLFRLFKILMKYKIYNNNILKIIRKYPFSNMIQILKIMNILNIIHIMMKNLHSIKIKKESPLWGVAYSVSCNLIIPINNLIYSEKIIRQLSLILYPQKVSNSLLNLYLIKKN